MEDNILLHFVTLTIFSLMLAIGINHSFEEVIFLWRRPQLLIRSLLAAIILVPFLVAALLWVFDLSPAVATGLAVLAAAPGAPLTTKRSQMAGGDPIYTASLQLSLALLAVLATPLILAVFYGLFDLVTETVSPLQVLRQVAQVTFLPVIIGLGIQRFAPEAANRMGRSVRLLSNTLFILLLAVVVVLAAVKAQLRGMLNLGPAATVAIIIMVGGSLAIGHLLGGPSRDQRSSLAIASVARNLGLSLFIAGLSDYGDKFIPTLLTYVVLGSVLATPYSMWSKRRLKKDNKPSLDY